MRFPTLDLVTSELEKLGKGRGLSTSERNSALDVRLQVLADGQAFMHAGDPSQDPSREGCWGHATGVRNDLRFYAANVAKDLIQQVKDAALGRTANANGLTFPAWLQAAGFGEASATLQEAWERNEDPADHRVVSGDLRAAHNRAKAERVEVRQHPSAHTSPHIPPGEGPAHDLVELGLYAMNTSAFHPKRKTILSVLKTHIHAGTYTRERAEALWLPWVNDAAKALAKEHGVSASKRFPETLRRTLARDVAEQQEAHLASEGHRVSNHAKATDAMPSSSEAMKVGLKLLAEGGAAPRREDDNSGDIVYFEQGTMTWYRVSSEEVEALGVRSLSGERDAYSRWCAETTTDEVDADEAEAMPLA